MKLQNIPILAALLLWSLSVPVLADGRRGGGGHGGGGGGGHGGGGRPPFGVGAFRPGVGPRGGMVGGRPGMVSGRPVGRFGDRRFDNRRDGRFFDHRRQFNRQGGFNIVYGAYPFPYYGGSGGSYPIVYPNSTLNQYPQSYYYSNYPTPVAEYSPVIVTGDVVANVQRALKNMRFYYGPIDGVSGPATRAAIRAYDSAAGLPVTGMIDVNLLASLRLL